MKKRTRQHGFTLVELLVAISIIAILTTMGMISFQGAQRSARDARRKNDLKVVQYALTEWKQDNPNTTYPTTWTAVMTAIQTNYLKGQTVQDPRQGTAPYSYTYTYTAATDTYVIRACLENANDAQGVAVAAGQCTGGSGRKFEVTNP